MKFNLLKLLVICATLILSTLSSAFIPQQDIVIVTQTQTAPVVLQADDAMDDDRMPKR